MSIPSDNIASLKQQILIAQIEYHMAEFFDGKTKKDVWEFINKHINGLTDAQTETVIQHDYREMKKLNPRYSKFRL